MTKGEGKAMSFAEYMGQTCEHGECTGRATYRVWPNTHGPLIEGDPHVCCDRHSYELQHEHRYNIHALCD